jgi:hypothetical protein
MYWGYLCSFQLPVCGLLLSFSKGTFSRVKANEELWFYIFFTTASVVAVTLILYTGTERNFEEAFRHSFSR